MNKKTIATKILSCMLVLCLLLSSFLTISFFQGTQAAGNPTYILKTFNYPIDETPVLWRYPGEIQGRPLSNTYYRGAPSADKDNYQYVAYCMDWGVKGPSSSGSEYDHTTTDVSQEKINQMTYVLMNGYSGSDGANAKSNTYTLTNKYNVDRHGRPLTLTDDGGTGTMCMQMATQIAIWLVMGEDSRGRDMYETGWVPNDKCQNIDKDIMEMAFDLYHNALKYGSSINWLSTNIENAVAGFYEPKTGSKLYGPIIAESDFVKNGLSVDLLMSNAPAGTEILDENYKKVSSIDVGERFYVSVPATAKDTIIDINLTRDMGKILPLAYEETDEVRQRMFFSSLSAATTTLSVHHKQSDATLTIHKQVNDAAPHNAVSLSSAEGYTFLLYYYETLDGEPQYLGDFETDEDGKIFLTGLNPGYYQLIEAMNYSQEQAYEALVVKGFLDANGKPIAKGEDYEILPNTANGIVSFQIKESGLDKNYNVYYLNQRHDATRLTITKIDKYTGQYLTDAHFRIYKMKPNVSGNGFDYAKDENGNYIYYDGYTYDDSMGQVIFGRTEKDKGSKYLPLDVEFTNGQVLEKYNTYRIVEKTPIQGYDSSFDMKFTISENEVNKVIALYNHIEESTDEHGIVHTDYYVTNRPFLNALRVEKYEAGTKKPIPDVTFAIYEELFGELNFVTSITTDENGVAEYGYNAAHEIDVENGYALRYGRKYFLLETSAPEGYVLTDTMIAIPPVEHDLTVQLITVENEPQKDGSFNVVKVDDEGNKIENTEFTLYKVKEDKYNEFDEFFLSYKGLHTKENSEYKYLTYFLDNNKEIDISEIENFIEKVATYTTDKDGLIARDVPWGEYIIIETKAAEGYNLLNAIYRFGIYANGVKYEIECVNDPITGSVKLIKTDSVTGEYIEGVKFTLYREGEAEKPDIKIGDYTTNSNGAITIENLEYGKYYFIETQAPDKYLLPSEEVSKEATRFDVVTQGEANLVTLTNTQKPCTVVILKTEKDKPDVPVVGAKFALMQGDTKVAEAITNSSGEAVFTDLALGEYTLVEIATAPGYDINSFKPMSISLKEHTVLTIQVNNEKIKGNIKVLKIDKDSEKPLEGVEFTLYAADDLLTPLRKLTTDKDGIVVFENIEFGSYIVKETKVLDGYIVSDAQIIVNVEECKEYLYTVSNELIKRNIKLIKIDKDTTIPIANVEFDVYALVDGEYIKYTTVITDENGECNFTLPFGEYELRETKTGKGYKLTDETTKIDLTTDDIEDILQITITNEIIKNRIILRKSGDTLGNYLANARYGLYDLSTDELIREGVTDENGICDFGMVSYGSYYLKEIAPPKGYELSNDVYRFTVDENSEIEQIIDVIDTSIPQTGHRNNGTAIAILLAISAALALSIAAINSKEKANT